MRRVLRRCGRGIVGAALALAAAAFVLVAVGWVRSYWFGDVFEQTTVARTAAGVYTNDQVRVMSARGAAVVSFVRRQDRQAGPRRQVNLGGRGVTLEPWPPTPFRVSHRSHSVMEPEGVTLLRRTWAQKLGFNARHMGKSTPFPDGSMTIVSDWTVRLPHWFLLLVDGCVLLAGAGVVRRTVRRRRLRKGLCGVCGYDLRATADRCPECGTALPAAPAPPPALLVH